MAQRLILASEGSRRSMHSPDQLVVASTFVIVGFVTFFVSLPLLYRKLRMNRFYGIRIPQAFVSKARWYEINEYGGRPLALWSWPITLFGVIGFLVPSCLFSPISGSRWE